MNLRYATAFVLAILLGVQTAHATPNGEEGWRRAVDALAQAVAAQGDVSTISPLLSDRSKTVRLDGRETSIRELLAISGGTSWRQSLAYKGMPDELSSDLSAALAVTAAPQELKRYLLPQEEKQRRQADALAVKWIAAALGPRGDQPIGAVLLYRESTTGARFAGRLLVILVAGEETSVGDYRIRQIAFGEFKVPSR